MIKSGFKIWSVWDIEHFRNGQKIDQKRHGNVCTDQGLNENLGVMFNQETQITDWRVCVFEDNYTPLETDTYALPGYTECLALQETTRPQFQPDAPSGKSISNISNKVSLTFTLNKTIYGAALIGGGTGIATIGDTVGGGIIFSASKFTNGSLGVIANDVIKVTITLSSESG